MGRVLIFFGLFVISCGSSRDMVIEKENLLKVDREFAETSKNLGAAEAFSQYLSEDALQLPEGGIPLRGRQNIYNKMKQNSGEYELLWEPAEGEVSTSGDFGYTWGNYTYVYSAADGNKKKSYGKYLNIWKKEADGTWKVIVDMGNSGSEKASDKKGNSQ